MIVLGIETSCDDTGVAILKIKNNKLEILSNLVSSQIKIHAKYGGVWPFLAKREHQKNLPIIFKKALKKTKISPKDIDLVAITTGPGLEPCLWIGINFVKDLVKKFNLPIVSVNHIEAHILINFLKPKIRIFNFQFKIFPAICLIVSGGHTQLILMEKIGKYKLLGETRDDAAGECFDKVARLLGLGYPGGPAIERYSKLKVKNQKLKIELPRPMINQNNYDFSFSGLKTAVLYDFQERPKKIRESKEYKILMAKEVQEAVVDCLVSKTIKSSKDFKTKTIILGGGVAANEKLRKKIIAESKLKNLNCKILIPRKEYCTDNGLMVALTGYFHKDEFTKKYDKIEANANLKI